MIGAVGNTFLCDTYDLEAHGLPIYSFPSIEKFLENEKVLDGIYHVYLNNGIYLDICLQGMEYFSNDLHNRSCLVNFSGAVSNRAGKKAPFFSGLGLARLLQSPLISFSDPTLALDANIPIGWYAGNESLTDLPIYIARILNMFAQHNHTRLLLFGGSGGGFACLSVAKLLHSETIVFVWNPQTSIEDFSINIVDRYMKVAFPSAFSAFENYEKERLVECMDQNELHHNLCDEVLPINVQLLYIQNLDDWHTQRHAAPYMEQYELSPYGNGSFIDVSGRRVFFFGHWGKRHAVPPYKMIRNTIENLITTKSVVLAAWNLDNGIEDVFENTKPVLYFQADKDKNIFAVDTTKIGNDLKVSCILKDKYIYDDGVRYAFYLYSDDNRVTQCPYSNQNETTFKIIDEYEKTSLSVVVFVKDRFNGMRKKRFNIGESK